jgi:hypothetical protein
MMVSMRYIVLFTILGAMLGCDPTRFTVLSDRDLDCRIYSDHRLVKKAAAGFDLLPGGCVAVTYLWATQYRASFRMTLQNGDGFVVMMRPVVEETIIDSGIVLTMSSRGYSLRSGDTLLASGTLLVQKGKTEIFRTYNEEGYLEVTYGCDTLYKGLTRVKESDDIIFATLPQSTVSVFGPLWQDLELIESEKYITIIK